jgi:hypothetical protein
MSFPFYPLSITEFFTVILKEPHEPHEDSASSPTDGSGKLIPCGVEDTHIQMPR